MGQSQHNNSLMLKITLGETQSHQLFDFQNQGIQHEPFPITSPTYLLDKGETVQFLNQPQYLSIKNTLNPNNQQINILKVTLLPYNQIQINNLSKQPHSVIDNRDTLWRCIKPNQIHSIKQGDIIKIGKLKLQLKRIVETKQESYLQQETVKDFHQQESVWNQNQHDNVSARQRRARNNNNDNNQNDDLESIKSGHSSCDRCRVCFRSFNVKNDPLLCLCKCSGSIKYIHFLCLKDWIANNFQKRQEQHYKFYTYQETNCQLCKHSLPNQFKHEGRMYSFLDFSTFQPPYAEFEYVEEENNKRKFYRYIISLTKGKQAVIGRNNSSQVVMKDISISRTHCSLEYTGNGMLVLRDKKSKFGTLVRLQRQTDFSSQMGLQLQFNSKVIELYNNSAFTGCCRDGDSYRLLYEQGGIVSEMRNSNNNISNSGQYRRRADVNVNVNSVNYNSNSEDNNSHNIRGMQANHTLPTTVHIHVNNPQNNSQNQQVMALEQFVNMQQNMQSNSQVFDTRIESGRITMVRDTIARDSAIRY